MLMFSSFFEADDVIEIRLPCQLAAGDTPVITLLYSGEFKDGLEGFYRSKYETTHGKQHQLAVTFMEPTCARQVSRHPSSSSIMTFLD